MLEQSKASERWWRNSVSYSFDAVQKVRFGFVVELFEAVIFSDRHLGATLVRLVAHELVDQLFLTLRLAAFDKSALFRPGFGHLGSLFESLFDLALQLDGLTHLHRELLVGHVQIGLRGLFVGVQEAPFKDNFKLISFSEFSK